MILELHVKRWKSNRKMLFLPIGLRLEAIHKRRPQSGGIVQCGHFADKRGSSDVDVRTF